MSIFLGVVYAFIVAALLVLLGLLIQLLCRWFGWPIDDKRIERVYLLLVLLITIYLIVAAFAGGLPRPYYPFH